MVGHSPNQNEAEEEQQNLRVTATGVNIPQDIIYDILCLLPAKSVGRFRCVRKNWKVHLSSPKFLKSQFSFNSHQTKIITHQNNKFYSIDLRNASNNEGNLIAFHETLNFSLPTNDGYCIRGSCNGLILLYDSSNLELSITNPITHELLQLPPIPECIVRTVCIRGFGYCLNDGEYSVVIASYHTPSPVYMLKRNLWKRVEDSPLFLHGYGAFVNGCIHWFGYRDSDNSIMICTFDLASERFQEVEKPESLKNGNALAVDVLGGCLCLVVYHENFTTDIWVMKKYGLRDSWTNYVVYNSQNLLVRPLFFRNCDESIIAEGGGRFILCCLKQNTLTIIPVIGDQCPQVFGDAKWTFVDSLFSPNSSNALEGPNQVQV